MPNLIHLTVATVIHREGEFLMVRENDGELEVINQPAGHVEPGETLQAAALRETLEETGWRVSLTGVLGISTYLSPRNNITYYRVCFSADPIEMVHDATLDDDIIAAEWLTLADLQAQQHQLRSPMVMHSINRYLQGTTYPMELIDNGPFDQGPVKIL